MAFFVRLLNLGLNNECSCRKLLAHLSRRLKGELIVYRWIRRPLVRPCVRASVGPWVRG